MSARKVVLAGVFPLVMTIVAAAQQSVPAVQEHAEVNLVNLTVVVVDGDGKPVPGLTAADFSVLEDGRSVEVRNAAQVASTRPPAAPADQVTAPAAAPARAGEPAESIIVFADCANSSPSQRNAVLEQLRPVLRDLASTRRATVMVASGTLGIQVEQSFTSDPALIDAALDRVSKVGGASGIATVDTTMLTRLIDSGVGGSDDFAAADRQDQLLSAQSAAQTAYDRGKGYLKRLGSFMGALGGIPGRKVMLWIGDGVQLRPGERLLQQWYAAYGSSSDSSGSPAGVSASRFNLSIEFNEMLHQANSSRVHIVTIAPTGSSGSAATADQSVMETTQILGAASMERMGMEQTLAAMAVSTGGEALIGGDVAARAARALTVFGDAYSLGFLDTHPGDGKYHSLKVKVNRPGLQVRHSEGYFNQTAEGRATEASLSGLYLNATDNPLELGLTVRSMAKDKGSDYSVVLLTVIPLGNVILAPKGEAHEASLALWLAARDANGKVIQSTRQTLPLQVPNSALASAQGQSAGYTFKLSLPPGPTRAAVTVVDQLGHVQSTVATDLVVGEGAPAGAKP